MLKPIARFDPERHHRRSIRLKSYDYAQAGAYFVTICAQDRACMLGDVVDGCVALNDAGLMVQTAWDELTAFYPGVDTDAFVVMPNHIHGIILVGAGPRACPSSGTHAGIDAGTNGGTEAGTDGGTEAGTGSAANDRSGSGQGQARGPAPTGDGVADGGVDGGPQMAMALSLTDVIHRFKTLTTKRYTDGVKKRGWPPFRGRFWQRNYYEHVIRDMDALDRVRQYIDENPLRWSIDRENPAASVREAEERWMSPP